MHPRRRDSLPAVSVTLELSPEVVARLRAEADRRRLSVDAVVEELAASLPAAVAQVPQRLGFVGIGRSRTGRAASGADDLLAEGFGRDQAH